MTNITAGGKWKTSVQNLTFLEGNILDFVDFIMEFCVLEEYTLKSFKVFIKFNVGDLRLLFTTWQKIFSIIRFFSSNESFSVLSIIMVCSALELRQSSCESLSRWSLVLPHPGPGYKMYFFNYCRTLMVALNYRWISSHSWVAFLIFLIHTF